MKRSALVLGLVAATSAFALVGERNAAACGGCFHPPAQVASDITDERMLLSVSPKQTTLYDQIRYSGSPSSFAWVLPIHGTVDVGLSADVLFDSIDTLTATQINPPPTNCAPPPNCGTTTNGAFAAPESASGAGGGVTVTKSENVGPYATVQLHSTDPGALNNWLTQNGFSIPADVQPIIDEYMKEGFDFLAMKLLPNQGVQAMRPVRVTAPGASLSLPLRMAAIGTGATVGITIWVVSDGRYEPQNFPSFHIEDKDLIWDFNASQSNYTSLRAQNEAALNGKGWELESSIAIDESTISNLIQNGGTGYYNGGGNVSGSGSNASDDYLPVTTSGDGDGGAEGGTTESADQVRMDDINALFAGMAGPNVRVTRMRSDISHAAMTSDFVLQAAADQSEMTNVRTVTQSVNLTCPSYPSCGILGTGILGGCDASSGTPIPRSGPGTLAVIAGMLGLVGFRLLKNKKRARK